MSAGISIDLHPVGSLSDWAGRRLFAVLVEIATCSVPTGAGSGPIVPGVTADQASPPAMATSDASTSTGDSCAESLSEVFYRSEVL